MRARTVPILFLAGSLALLGYAAKDLRAQNSSNSASPANVIQAVPDANAAPPGLSYGAEEVLKLAQAKVSGDTMLAFVQSSHLNYDLDALGIVYLRQQGVSDPVVTAMLQKSKEVVDEAQAATAAQPAASTSAAVITPTTAAPVPQPDATYAQATPDYGSAYPTYVEPAPTYVYDDYYSYYPYYGWPYPLGIGFGFGYGGYYHGYYHGGGFHGGGFHGGGGGGFHGGSRGGGSFHH
jgi:hypothetical protein